jgi:hypothetical protein
MGKGNRGLRRGRGSDSLSALRSLRSLRAGSFGSPFGLAQDFASWRTPAERLNFGRVDGDFLSTFVRGLTTTAKTNAALRARVFAA